MKWTLSAVAIFLFVILLFGQDDDLKISTYQIETDKIHESIRLALITDLHSCEYGEGESEIIQKLSEIEPDAVLFGGDIADIHMPRDNMEILISRVAATYKTYYVTGNHEFRRGDQKDIKNTLEGYGVIVLEGDCSVLNIRSDTINICGIDDYEISKRKFSEQLRQAGTAFDDNRYKILLTHRPEQIKRYLQYDFDLIISGHTHGGQWRIPGILNGVFAPDQGLFPRYGGGKYEFPGTILIISRGLARETTPIPRIFNPPEIVIVDLVADNE